ncbi:potassium-transporting ATPase subunit C, partial [Muribaculaceae bacterium Isolate-002 (NCI)]
LNSAPLVNVLKLNMALDLMGSADAKAMPAPGEVGR